MKEDVGKEKCEKEEGHSISSQIPPGGMISFVASSDAECSAVSMVDIKANSTSFVSGSCDSNEGFELIDEGRVDGVPERCEQVEENGANEVERDIHDVQVCSVCLLCSCLLY